MNDNVWPREEGDFMEIGTSGWVAITDGAFFNKNTGIYMNAEGKLFSSLKEMKEHDNAQDE